MKEKHIHIQKQQRKELRQNRYRIDLKTAKNEISKEILSQMKELKSNPI